LISGTGDNYKERNRSLQTRLVKTCGSAVVNKKHIVWCHLLWAWCYA